MNSTSIITFSDPILVTGAGGFVGNKVVENLLAMGYKNIRCFVRPSGNIEKLKSLGKNYLSGNLQFIKGNLLVRDDCLKAVDDVAVVYHLAAGRGKSFSGCFIDSAVATRNLLDALKDSSSLKRFVNVSSFAVYSNHKIPRRGLLDETCPIEREHMVRYDPYAYAKIKQDDLVLEYALKYNLPYTIVRPGVVFGPGKNAIPGRVGIGTFGVFLHLGGKNKIPLTYVDNCANAIIKAGLVDGINGEVFNIVDDNLPSSRYFFKLYKKNVRRFFSISIPYFIFYRFCYFWERYYYGSKGQIPLAFNRRMCAAYWKGNRYTNLKAKNVLGWAPIVKMKDAIENYFEYCQNQKDTKA